ncbi:hypothetical protein SCYAM73S_08177 [Streptomyces cyaneofuscatus]
MARPAAVNVRWRWRSSGLARRTWSRRASSLPAATASIRCSPWCATMSARSAMLSMIETQSSGSSRTAGATQSAYTVRSSITGSPSSHRTRSTYSTWLPGSASRRSASSSVAVRSVRVRMRLATSHPIACAHCAKLLSCWKLWRRSWRSTTRRAPCREPIRPSEASSATAWRTVPRETSQRAERSLSDGSREPSG